jgi:hypothetical protein
VSSFNFNGESDLSDPLDVYACVAPGTPQQPYRISGSKTSLTLGWSLVSDTGGCTVTGFQLFRNDGESGAIDIEVDPVEINDKPTLTEHEVTFSTADTGKSFKF